MKIAPLLVASATALETSTSASALLAAVGKRNVTHMQALVQSLAEESIKEPGWKFDEDIQQALSAIQNMFVKNIQDALKEQHKADQEGHNCETRDCWAKCNSEFDGGQQRCGSIGKQVNGLCEQHKMCRYELKNKYEDYWGACGMLHCFKPPVLECPEEECICHGLDNCAMKKQDPSGNMICEANDNKCHSHAVHGYGAWLQKMISAYETAHTTWKGLYDKCQISYKDFLLLDTECDSLQAGCEKGACELNNEEKVSCGVDKEQCDLMCWETYRKSIPHLQCQEKDRKIDWSATKKIECYLRVLLHDYTEDDLIERCNNDRKMGKEACVSFLREDDYHKCETVCPTPDYEGSWQEPTCDSLGNVGFDGNGHPFRDHVHSFLDQYIGDSKYECDMNGEEVHTNHRMYFNPKDPNGGSYKGIEKDEHTKELKGERPEETRCTEHLDIDFQIPQYKPCLPPNNEPCDAEWHCTHYAEFDDGNKLDGSDCCFEEKILQGSKGGCFGTVSLTTCADHEAYENDKIATLSSLTFAEDTIAWAYNRCECKRCTTGTPIYPEGPFSPGCSQMCNGPHKACFYALGEPAY